MSPPKEIIEFECRIQKLNNPRRKKMSAKKIVIKETLLILLLTALSVVSLYHVREVFFSLKNLIPKEDIEAFY